MELRGVFEVLSQTDAEDAKQCLTTISGIGDGFGWVAGGAAVGGWPLDLADVVEIHGTRGGIGECLRPN